MGVDGVEAGRCSSQRPTPTCSMPGMEGVEGLQVMWNIELNHVLTIRSLLRGVMVDSQNY